MVAKTSPFVFALALALNVSQSLHSQSGPSGPDRVIVHNGCKGQNASFFFSYINIYRDEVLSPRLLSQGDTTIRGDYIIATSQPVIIIFSADFTPYPVYAEPGDTINVSCHKDRPRYTFTGNSNRDELNFLVRMEKQFGFTFPDLGGLRMTNQLDLANYADSNRKKFEEKDIYLRRNADSLKLSPEYVNTISTLLKYRYVNNLLRPYFTKQSSQFEWVKIPKTYDEKLQEILLHTKVGEREFWSSQLFSLVVNYNRFLAKDSLIKYPNREFEVLFESAEKHFEGIAKDYILLKLIKEFHNKGIKDMTTYVQRYKSMAHRADFANYVDALLIKINEDLPKAALATELKNTKGQSITFDHIIQQNQGRIIYIDFWASWCGPCIQEMPGAKSLEEKLIKEPVSFVYISIDRSNDLWLKAIDKHQLNCEKCEHYVLDDKSELAKYFTIPPIPCYLLVDKSGKVAASNAPRPSDPVLMEKVRGMLK